MPPLTHQHPRCFLIQCYVLRLFIWSGKSLLHITNYRYDEDKSGFIDLMELKRMMEKLGEPQTHLGLKTMIKEVDEDNDGEISFREVRVKGA